LKGCAHVQPEVAQYPPYWSLFTEKNIIKRHVTRSGSLGRVRWAHAQPEVGDFSLLEIIWPEMTLSSVTRRASPGSHVTRNTMGCSLERPCLSFSTSFTGYFTVILMRSTFNNYISYVCCFQICCVVLQAVYHVCVAFFFLYFQRSLNVLFINCSFLQYFFSWTFYL
jgi:hypothetical protein